ncbi:MAG: HD domain-containing protein [Candidatus Thorarchaeota archaeon]
MILTRLLSIMTSERLTKQLEFILEIDKLKRIMRQTLLTVDRSHENDAEHSWHIALMTLLLSEYSTESNLDIQKVIKMVLIHDIIEIDAGDTFCYDYKAGKDKKERELVAAERIFTILPEDQAQDFRDVWDEFEEMQSSEAKFAAAMDRLQPLLLNFNTEGESWRKHGVSRSQVIQRNEHIKNGSAVLWDFASWLIDESVRRGYLQDK